MVLGRAIESYGDAWDISKKPASVPIQIVSTEGFTPQPCAQNCAHRLDPYTANARITLTITIAGYRHLFSF